MNLESMNEWSYLTDPISIQVMLSKVASKGGYMHEVGRGSCRFGPCGPTFNLNGGLGQLIL